MKSQDYIRLEKQYNAHNYAPLVITRNEIDWAAERMQKVLMMPGLGESNVTTQ